MKKEKIDWLIVGFGFILYIYLKLYILGNLIGLRSGFIVIYYPLTDFIGHYISIVAFCMSGYIAIMVYRQNSALSTDNENLQIELNKKIISSNEQLIKVHENANKLIGSKFMARFKISGFSEPSIYFNKKDVKGSKVYSTQYKKPHGTEYIFAEININFKNTTDNECMSLEVYLMNDSFDKPDKPFLFSSPIVVKEQISKFNFIVREESDEKMRAEHDKIIAAKMKSDKYVDTYNIMLVVTSLDGIISNQFFTISQTCDIITSTSTVNGSCKSLEKHENIFKISDDSIMNKWIELGCLKN